MQEVVSQNQQPTKEISKRSPDNLTKHTRVKRKANGHSSHSTETLPRGRSTTLPIPRCDEGPKSIESRKQRPLPPPLISPRLVVPPPSEDNTRDTSQNSGNPIREISKSTQISKSSPNTTIPTLKLPVKLTQSSDNAPIISGSASAREYYYKMSPRGVEWPPRRKSIIPKEELPPGFPPEPPKIEKFPGGDKIEYKIWMRQRARYEKWENALLAYKLRKNEGNLVSCKKIVDNLILEMEEMQNSIQEDLYLKEFPPPPPKPENPCPEKGKEAKLWNKQKLAYESWENAFALYKVRARGGDTEACKKIVSLVNLNGCTSVSISHDFTQSQRTKPARFSRMRSRVSSTSSSSKPSGDIFNSSNSPSLKIPSPKYANSHLPPISNLTVASSSNMTSALVSPRARPLTRPPASWGKNSRMTLRSDFFSSEPTSSMEKYNRDTLMDGLENVKFDGEAIQEELDAGLAELSKSFSLLAQMQEKDDNDGEKEDTTEDKIQKPQIKKKK